MDNSVHPSTGKHESQEDPEAKAATVYKSYKIRWYVLLVVSIFNFIQSFLYNMWGPIFASMIAILGWSNTQVAVLPLYGVIFLSAFSIPGTWLLEKFGFRKLIVINSALMALSCAIRCVPLSETFLTIVINLSSLINAVPGVVTLFMAPAISATWFPPGERRIATTIGETSNIVGVAAAFVVGPAFISEPQSGKNETELLHEYFVFTYAETGFCLLLFIVALIYFPEKPKSFSSESAETERVQVLAGVKKCLEHRDFWLLTLTWMLSLGTYIGLISVLGIDLSAHSHGSATIDQKQAGWIGFWSFLGGAGTGLLAGKFADWVGHLKAIQSVLCFAIALSAVWLFLLLKDFIPFSVLQIYISVIVLGSAVSALSPITFELAAEIMFPIDEAVVVGLLSSIGLVWSGVFLAVFLVPSVGTAWMDWVLAIGCAAAFPFSLLIRERYNRAEMDQGDDEQRQRARTRALSVNSTG